MTTREVVQDMAKLDALREAKVRLEASTAQDVEIVVRWRVAEGDELSQLLSKAAAQAVKQHVTLAQLRTEVLTVLDGQINTLLAKYSGLNL